MKDIKILLVEDNLLNQQLTANILNREGYIADLAVNGKEGVNMFMKNKYEIVLMDIQMPVMDGIQATKLIREYERTTGCNKSKIIAVTAHAQEEEKENLFNAGMDLYLSKPFRADELLSMIKSEKEQLQF